MKNLLIAVLLAFCQVVSAQIRIDLPETVADKSFVTGQIKAAEARQKAYADSLFKVKGDGGAQNPPTDTRKLCAEVGRDPKILSISEVKSNSLSLQFDAENVFELEYDIENSSGNRVFRGAVKPNSSRVNLPYDPQSNGVYTLRIRGFSCKSGDDTKNFEVKTDQGGGKPDPGEPGSGNPPPAGDHKFTYQLIMGTTGAGFDPNAKHGIMESWVERIEATKFNWVRQLTGTRDYAISGPAIWIGWDIYEPSPGQYQEEAFKRVIQYCRERNLSLSVVFMRRRAENDGFLRPDEIITGSNGTKYVEGVPGFGSVYAGYANERVNALSAGAIKSIARLMATYDKSFYIALAGGGAGEQVNYVFNGKEYREAADFSADNEARYNAWRIPRGIDKEPGLGRMIQGKWNDWPHFDYKTVKGEESARFTTYGLRVAFDSFAEAVRSQTKNLVVTYFYSVTSNLQFRSIANPNINWIAENADGVYGSDGDGIGDQKGKFKVNALNLGTFPSKVSMAEVDPDDVSGYEGPDATPPYCHGGLFYDVFENMTRALFDRGLMVQNLAMSWCPSELKGAEQALYRLNRDYIGKEYRRPDVNASNTVTVDVTDKYRASIDLMEDITDVQNKYVKYVSPTFFGGVSPWLSHGGGNDDDPAPQPSKDYTPVKSHIENNISKYNWNVIFDMRAPSGELYSFRKGQYNKDSPMRVMSHSKFTTGVIISYLIDQGKLSLDTRVGDVIRAWDRADKKGITIRQIMGHLSGIPDNQSNEGAKTLDEHVNWIAGLDLEFTPGTQFKYSTVSYQVAARVAELVTGKKWKDLFKDILAGPCEMGQAEYNPLGTGDVRGNPDNPLAGYGLICSEREWMNFISMIRDGGMFKGRRVLNSGVFDILKTRTSPGWSDWGVGVMFRDGQYISEAASGVGTAILPSKYALTIFTQSSYESTYWPNRQVIELAKQIYEK